VVGVAIVSGNGAITADAVAFASGYISIVTTIANAIVVGIATVFVNDAIPADVITFASVYISVVRLTQSCVLRF
jgi:hypothetical protein